MLNPRDLDVLSILWKTSGEMTATDITNEKGYLTQSTVIAVLRKLVKDDYVEVVGVTHSGRVLSRTYRPTEKAREAVMGHFLDTYKMVMSAIPKADMCSAILSVEQNPEDLQKEVSKLREIVTTLESTI